MCSSGIFLDYGSKKQFTSSRQCFWDCHRENKTRIDAVIHKAGNRQKDGIVI